MNTVKDLIDLKGRRALITGAAGGLGQVMAHTLAELGADLILVDKTTASLANISSHLQEKWGSQVEILNCDLELENQRAELITSLREEGRNLNILINNAAFVGTSELQGWSTPFEKQSLETWRRALEVNITAIFDLCQGLTPILRKSTGSNIINIASIYGTYGPDWSLYEGTEMGNPAAYAVSKGGLIQFTRWLATSISPEIRVNAISPGGIQRNQPETFVKKYNAKVPLGRMATEDDFIGAITFLATDLSEYMTGQNLIIDGGWGV